MVLSVNTSRATSPIDREAEEVVGGAGLGKGKGVGSFIKEMIDKEIPLGDETVEAKSQQITRNEVKRRMGIAIPTIAKEGDHAMDGPSSDEERRREQKEFFFQRYDPNKNLVKGGVASSSKDRENHSI